MQINSLSAITSEHRHIYLSPHFDDAVYSCGSTIGKQGYRGERPLVITVFTGVPPSTLKLSLLARRIHRVMGFEGETGALLLTRRQEDEKAISRLRADYLWCDYLDAIYRGTPAHYPHKRSISSKVHTNDIQLLRELARHFNTLHKRLPGVTWYAPLAMGYHVDHQILFSVANHLQWCGANVRFYEDFPYGLHAQALQKRLKEISRELGETLKPLLVEVQDTLHLRQEAAALYTSQIKLNFGNKEKMYMAIRDYSLSIDPTKSLSLERFWTHQRTYI